MKEKYQILIVDDTEINRMILSEMLSDQYGILEATNGIEAISILEKKHSEISLVLLDIMMPIMTGFEVMSVMSRSGWLESLPVIVISAETSATFMDEAYDLGATDYLSRPFDEKTVQRRVKNTIMLYAKQKMLEGMVTEQILEKERNDFLMVEILSNIVEFRNGESGLHVLHIRTITELLIRHLTKMTEQYPLTPSQIALIVNASALHDIGKISIPEEILNKPGKLTKEEFEIMKTHSAIGAQILENNRSRQNEELVQYAHDICRWHHERFDGRGYPDGLKGEEIPIAAQVVAMADVYDALISERVYKPAYSHEKALEMILNGECGAFNPILLKCLLEMGPRIQLELGKNTQMQVSQAEVSDIAMQLLSSGKVSNRTLEILEQERIKYQFFSSLSKEIQFEYNKNSDLLTFSAWGAEQLGIGEVILHPEQNIELLRVIHYNDLQDLMEKVTHAEEEDPIIETVYTITARGKERRYLLTARPLWISENHNELTGVIGKLTEPDTV